VLEEDIVETGVKGGVEKVTHREVVPRQRRIEGFKTGTTQKRSVEHVPSFWGDARGK
jgi:hypothetical protein